MRRAVTSYSRLAMRTLSASDGVRSGIPWMCNWLRSGRGPAEPSRIGISLAREEVPHGGPKCTKVHNSGLKSDSSRSTVDCKVRSKRQVLPSGRRRPPAQSMPTALNPTADKAAVSLAVPLKISMVTGPLTGTGCLARVLADDAGRLLVPGQQVVAGAPEEKADSAAACWGTLGGKEGQTTGVPELASFVPMGLSASPPSRHCLPGQLRWLCGW